MFNNTKYTKWYMNITTNAKKKQLDQNQIYERHHIIPKSFGGSNNSENIVMLTPKEHFICHLLLTKMCEGENKQKMYWALHRMTFSGDRIRKNSASYNLARNQFIANLKENHPSKKDPQGFSNQKRKSALKQWENNLERKQKLSEKRRHYIKENKDEWKEVAKKASIIGAAAISKKWKENREWAENEKIKMSARTSGEKNPMFGKKIEGNHLKKLSDATSRKRWIYNDIETLYVDKDLVEGYLKIGYKPGRKNYKRKESQ